jgi:hypothetical protein
MTTVGLIREGVGLLRVGSQYYLRSLVLTIELLLIVEGGRLLRAHCVLSGFVRGRRDWVVLDGLIILEDLFGSGGHIALIDLTPASL